MLERWGRAIRARRFYRLEKSARWCLAVEPNFGVSSGTRYFETSLCRIGLERKSSRRVFAINFACLAISTTNVSLVRSVYMFCAIRFWKDLHLTHIQRTYFSKMHCSTASILSALLSATLFQPFANAQQIVGSILHTAAEGDGIVLITVENNSTSDFSIEARNNLFDTNNPWQPMNVTNIAGKGVTLVGAEYQYGTLDDNSFVQMPAGAVWQRELNLTAYMPPDTTITKPTSKCYYVTFPDGFWAINTTDMPAGESLATQFLTPGANRLVDLYIVSSVLHINITTVPASPATLVATTEAIPQQPAATEMVGSQTVDLAAVATDGTSIDEYDSILGA